MAKILVVDDAEFMRLRVRNLLEQHGYEVLEAGDGLDAVAKYQKLRPDMVLMDITMPNMDGIQALREIHKLDPKSKVVMLTALGLEQMVTTALREGAKDFLVKPFQKEKVMATVKRLIG